MRGRRSVGAWVCGWAVAVIVSVLAVNARGEEASSAPSRAAIEGEGSAAVSPDSREKSEPKVGEKVADKAAGTSVDTPAGKAAGPWEKVSNSDGILVERRTVPGSNLKEFRGRGVVDAALPRVLAVLQDAPHRTEWMSDCSSSYVIEENHEKRTQIAYHRTKAPWPVADRDSINRAEIHLDVENRRIVLPFEGIAHPKGPPVKGVVRMPFIRGHWILTAVRGGKATEVEYQVHANPGGSLPDWIANLASKKLPQQTLIGLRRQVKFREYPALEAEILGSPEARQIMGQAATATSGGAVGLPAAGSASASSL